jgi:hypothetical protein
MLVYYLEDNELTEIIPYFLQGFVSTNIADFYTLSPNLNIENIMGFIIKII